MAASHSPVSIFNILGCRVQKAFFFGNAQVLAFHCKVPVQNFMTLQVMLIMNWGGVTGEFPCQSPDFLSPSNPLLAILLYFPVCWSLVSI